MDSLDTFLTLQKVAHILAVHPNTVRRMIATGQMTAIRIGKRGDVRIRQRDLEQFIVARRAVVSV